MFSIDEIKKKRLIYEKKIEAILIEFGKDLPPEIKIENAVVISRGNTLQCSIRLFVEDLNT